MTRRVLLVDDDEAIREVARTSLELVAGWDVEVAAGVLEAVWLCAADPPDAVLLDVMMLTMDGPPPSPGSWPTLAPALELSGKVADLLGWGEVSSAERRTTNGEAATDTGAADTGAAARRSEAQQRG